MNVTALLHLPPLTRSIAFRPWLATLAGRPVLERLANQLLVPGAASRFVVLAHYEAEREALEQALAGTGAELRFTKSFSELHSIAELDAEFGSGAIASVSLASVLAPADLLKRMIAHFVQHQSSFTLLDNAPADVRIGLFEADVVRSLVRMAGPFNFHTTDDALRRLVALGETAWCRLPIKINFTSFELPTIYDLPIESLPREAPLNRAIEFTVASAALSGSTSSNSPTAVFEALKSLQIKRRQSASQCTPLAGPMACNSQPHGQQNMQQNMRQNMQQNMRPGSLPNAPKRALVLSLPSAFSGAEQALCSMLRFMDHARYNVTAVTCWEGVFTERLRAAGAEVIVPDWEVMPASLENFNWALNLLQQVKPDVLHLNGCTALPFLAAAHVTRTPIVQHVRNGEMAGMQDGLVAASRMIAITDFLRRETLRYPVDADRVRVVYDEVDSEWLNPAQFDRAACRHEFGLQPEERVALMVARVAPNKRHDLMLDAAALIRDRVPNFRLVLKGDVYDGGNYAHSIQQRIAQLGLEPQIMWRDFVPDLRRLMAASDLLVLCSDREGLGSCVVEAMAMGLPVVVTDTGGTHEIVDSGRVGGFVVPGSNPNALADRVSELLNNPELGQRLGLLGREHIRTRLDARISAASVMQIYDEAIAESAPERQA